MTSPEKQSFSAHRTAPPESTSAAEQRPIRDFMSLLRSLSLKER